MRSICRPIVQCLCSFVVPFILAVGTGGVAFGQDSSTASEYGNYTRPAITPEQAVVIREILTNLLETTESAARVEGAVSIIDSTVYARGVLDVLADEDLGIYVELIPSLGKLDAALSQISQGSRVDDDSSPSISSAGLPGAGYSSCGPNREDLKTFLIALQVVEGIWIGADHGCNFAWTIGFPLFPPFNFNASLACIPVDIAFDAARFVFEQKAFCNDDINSAEILGLYDNLGHIHTDLNVFRTTVYTEAQPNSSLVTNKLAIIKFRVDVLARWEAFVQQILGAIAVAKKKVEAHIMVEFDTQNLEMRTFRSRVGRLFIGEDLGSVSGLGRLGFYQLPSSFVCPNTVSVANNDPFVCPDLTTTVPCGSLENARDTVAEAIAMMKAAGQEVFDAPGIKVKGDHEFANGNYRLAHDLYSQAYRVATSLDGSG